MKWAILTSVLCNPAIVLGEKKHLQNPLFVFLWDFGTKDIEEPHHNGDRKTDSQIKERIFPGIQFAEHPHQERITDDEAQAGT